jgi:hypothetical protein
MNAGESDRSRSATSRATPVGLSGSLSTEPTCVGINDPAVWVVSDSPHEDLWTTDEGCGLDEVLDKMLRLRVRAFLVTRAQQVVGLISFEDVERGRRAHSDANRVADVMIDASHVPLIDWQTVLYATVSDLLQVFDSTHANHLVVVDTESGAFTRVRGLVYRRQLVGQLGVFPILDRGMELALGNCAARAPKAQYTASPLCKGALAVCR